MRYCPSVYEVPEDSWSSGRDFNEGSLEYEAEMPTTFFKARNLVTWTRS
jgi:hypothetical protein